VAAQTARLRPPPPGDNGEREEGIEREDEGRIRRMEERRIQAWKLPEAPLPRGELLPRKFADRISRMCCLIPCKNLDRYVEPAGIVQEIKSTIALCDF